MDNPIKLIKSLNWAKDDLKKFVFCICLIMFAVIILHVFPIKVVIDTKTMRHSRFPGLPVDIVGEIEVINR